MMDEADPRIGFFGKLPSHGDFVRRALPSALTKPWDNWLQAGLTASREKLGDAWLDCYLSAPIWRFCLSGGVCGEAQWMGAVMPSVDRVGRYFPLTAATAIPPNRSLFGMATTAHSWLTSLEEVMLTTLEEDCLTADEVARQLAAIDPLDISASAEIVPEHRQLSEQDCCVALALADPELVADAAGTLADALAQRSCGGFSLWWSSGSEHVAASVRVYTNLPPAELFWTLLRNERPLD